MAGLLGLPTGQPRGPPHAKARTPPGDAKSPTGDRGLWLTGPPAVRGGCRGLGPRSAGPSSGALPPRRSPPGTRPQDQHPDG
jgi:hypothetical protein